MLCNLSRIHIVPVVVFLKYVPIRTIMTCKIPDTKSFIKMFNFFFPKHFLAILQQLRRENCGRNHSPCLLFQTRDKLQINLCSCLYAKNSTRRKGGKNVFPDILPILCSLFCWQIYARCKYKSLITGQSLCRTQNLRNHFWLPSKSKGAHSPSNSSGSKWKHWFRQPSSEILSAITFKKPTFLHSPKLATFNLKEKKFYKASMSNCWKTIFTCYRRPAKWQLIGLSMY